MFLLVPAHPGCPRQNPESHKMIVVVVVTTCFAVFAVWFAAMLVTIVLFTAITLLKAVLGVNVGHPIVTNGGPLLHSCVKVREPIELSFGVVSGVSPVIDVQNGGPRVSRKGVDFVSQGILGLFAPLAHWFQLPHFQEKCIA